MLDKKAQLTKLDTDIKGKDDLINLVEFEIKRIQEEEAQPGWTKWALLGSLGSSFWLISLEFEKSSGIDASHIFLISLAFSISIDSIKILSRILTPNWIREKFALRFTQSSYVQSRIFTIAAILRCSILLLVINKFVDNHQNQLALIMMTFYSLTLLVYAGGFVMSFLKIPIPTHSVIKDYITLVVYTVLLIVGLFSLIDFIRIEQNALSSISMSEYRIAALLIVAFELAQIIAQGIPKTPLINSLVEIRHNLALGKLDIELGRRQIDIAIAGMSVSDVFQGDLAKLLSYLEQMNAHISSITREHIIITSSAEYNKKPISEEQIDLMGAVVNSTEVHVEQLTNIQNQFTKVVKQFENQAGVLKIISPETHDEIEMITEQLNKAMSRTLDSQIELDRQRRMFMDILETARIRLRG